MSAGSVAVGEIMGRNKREVHVPVYDRPGGTVMITVRVVDDIGEMARLLMMLVNRPADWHGPGEPKQQSAREFLRRHPEIKEG